MKGTFLQEKDLASLGEIAALLEEHAKQYSKSILGITLEQLPSEDRVGVEAMVGLYQRRAIEIREICSRRLTSYVSLTELSTALNHLNDLVKE